MSDTCFICRCGHPYYSLHFCRVWFYSVGCHYGFKIFDLIHAQLQFVEIQFYIPDFQSFAFCRTWCYVLSCSSTSSAAIMRSSATICRPGMPAKAASFCFWNTSLADLIPKGILVNLYFPNGLLV